MGIFDYSIEKLTNKKGFSNINIMDWIGLGILSGAIAISIANPFDMLKVRFQSDSGKTRWYKNVIDAM